MAQKFPSPIFGHKLYTNDNNMSVTESPRWGKTGREKQQESEP